MEAHYYAPYESDSSKSGSGSEASSDSETELSEDELSFEDTAARRLDNDYRYALVKAGGPNFNTLNEQLAFTKDNIGSAYSNELVADQTLQPSTVNPIYKQPKKQIVSSLFSFRSQDRDITVYPFSTYFSIKTPRVYKNITQIQLVQINIQSPAGSTFPDISALENAIANAVGKDLDISDCSGCFQSPGPASSSITSIGISEAGRRNPAITNQTLVHAIHIRPGSYNPVTLIDELDKQANKTPPLTTVSYAEHKRLFQSNKTVDHLFNEPGRWYQNKLSGEFFATNSKSDLINLYLPNLTLQDSRTPSEEETLVAYFFPVLREAFLSPFDSKFLDLANMDIRDAKKRILHTFESLGSPYYYTLCRINQPYLRTLRRAYTFEYHPINDYQWDIEQGSSRLIVHHANLHKSIQTDITKRYSYDKQQENVKAGITSQILQRQLQTEAIVTNLKHNVDSALVQLGIPYSLYSTSFLSISTNSVFTQTINALPVQQRTPNDDHLFALATGTLTPPTPAIPSGSGSFGWNTLATLIGDTTVGGGFPDPSYNAAVAAANAAAIVTQAGGDAIPGYGGVQVQATNFPSLYSTFVNYQSTNSGLSVGITSASNAAALATNHYVHSRYSTVFPPFLLDNSGVPTTTGTNAVTWYAGLHHIKPSTPFDFPNMANAINSNDPITSIGPFGTAQSQQNQSECCQLIQLYLRTLYGCVPTNFYINSAYYKMGFGFNNFISFYSTTGLANALRIDNIYITVNTEQTMNRMDVAKPQNISITQETTSEYNAVLGKILTEGTGVDTSTQAIVQSPARFNPPLANIDHVTFQLLLDDLTPFNLVVPFEVPRSAWNGIIQIDEEIGILENTQ
uniref:Uncharacterized protein n=1 Tax=viral metagenome TaxID=1070528 RepID=A0A6C0DHT0_9ZZZZ